MTYSTSKLRDVSPDTGGDEENNYHAAIGCFVVGVWCGMQIAMQLLCQYENKVTLARKLYEHIPCQ